MDTENGNIWKNEKVYGKEVMSAARLKSSTANSNMTKFHLRVTTNILAHLQVEILTQLRNCGG